MAEGGVKPEQRSSLSIEQAKATLGTVESLAKEGNVYFFHGIAAEKRLSAANNQALPRNATWEDKLLRLLRDQPEIAVHTIKRGTRMPHSWSPLGVMLRSGNVEYAHIGDAGSFVDVTGKRTTIHAPKDVKKYLAQLEVVKGGSGLDIKRNSAGIKVGWAHMEAGISKPEVAGIAVNLDSPNAAYWDVIKFNSPVHWPERLPEGAQEILMNEVFSLAKDYDMKLFFLAGGVAYEGELKNDSLGVHLVLTDEVSPEQMTKERPRKAVN